MLLVKYGNRWLFTRDKNMGRIAAILLMLNEMHDERAKR